MRWHDLVVRNVAKGGSWTFPARAGTTWLRLDQPSKNGRLRCGSDLAPTLRVRGVVPKRWVSPRISGHRPPQQFACGAAGLVQFGQNAGRDEKHGRQPLWLLDVSHNFGPRRRQLDPSRAGRARRRRNLLDRDSTAKAGTNLCLLRSARTGSKNGGHPTTPTLSAFDARSRVWRRLVRRQRRRDLFLEQYRSAALSSGCGGAAEPDHASSSGNHCGCVPVRRWRYRSPAGTNGLRPRRSHWGRRGDHDSSGRRPFRRNRNSGSRLGKRFLFQAM